MSTVWVVRSGRRTWPPRTSAGSVVIWSVHSDPSTQEYLQRRLTPSPDGEILWVSGQLPGCTHDTAAARIWNILSALDEAGLIALGYESYHGYDETRQQVITPYKGRKKPQSQKDANRAHARLRGPGERANANSGTGASCTKSASTYTALTASPKPSMCYRTMRSQQVEKGSLCCTS